MSKLDKLLEELCPNGVEYKKVEEIASFRRGSFPQPYTNANFYGGDGAMPFVQVADMLDDRFELSEITKQTISKIAQPKSVFVEKGTILVSIQGTIGRVAITQYDAFIDRTIAIFSEYSKILNQRFFAYVLKQKFDYEKKFARGSTLKTITKEEFSKFEIPVPPLPIQEEIVRILDNFTELTAELTAELQDRKKQYEYYRDNLLTFNNDIKTITVGDCFEIITDYTAAGSFADIAKNVVYRNEESYAQLVRTMDIKSNFTKGEPVFIDESAFNYLWRVNFDGDCIILPNIGANCGEVYFVKKGTLPYKNNALGPNAIMLKNTKFDIKFFYHLFMHTSFQKELRKIISPGGQTKFNKTDLKNIRIVLPSLEIQERIVNVLDNFEKICNDLKIGLPAEIELRQKQYEYYRDMLLTFPENDLCLSKQA